MPRERITGRSYVRVWSSPPCPAESRGAETSTLGLSNIISPPSFLGVLVKGSFLKLSQGRGIMRKWLSHHERSNKVPQKMPPVSLCFFLLLRQRFLYPTLTSNSLYSHILALNASPFCLHLSNSRLTGMSPMPAKHRSRVFISGTYEQLATVCGRGVTYI